MYSFFTRLQIVYIKYQQDLSISFPFRTFTRHLYWYHNLRIAIHTMKNILIALLLFGFTSPMRAQNPSDAQLEDLGRGVTAIPGQSNGMFVSWRLLATDTKSTTFDLLRNGSAIATDINTTTCYADATGTSGHTYQVVTKVNGEAVDTTEAIVPWSDYFYQLHLDLPTASGCTYTPGDCSAGDVDGDGEYEIIVKWDPSNAKDNSQGGTTGNVFLDCYKVNWAAGGAKATPEKLWRIDLGVNIRAGAHYTQFMVYDFDGDGRAEMMCKTAPGSKDGLGEYVSTAATDSKIQSCNNSKNWRNNDGRIDGGYEFLTVFEGFSGRAIHTVFYKPNRNATTAGTESTGTFNWDDRSGKTDKASYGNRGERYLAAVAHLDGIDKNAYGIFSRGYYTYAYIWAVGFDGTQLSDKWYHSSHNKNQYKVTDAEGNTKTYTPGAPTGKSDGSRTMYGNGNHNLSIGDVDGDGCDEVIWGAAALDNDGKLLYSTGFGHGDAMHLADHNPDRPGLELFHIHEGSPYGWDLHDAGTGAILFKASGSSDNGRGIAAQLSSTDRGSYFSSSNDKQQRSAVTGKIASNGTTSMNFRIFWDGDLQEELFDGGKIDNWNGTGTTRIYINGKNPYDYNASSTCNGSKSTPNLQADLFGDWREEIILWCSDDSKTLNVFTTNLPTSFRVPTLMHDHTYRMGIAWQNVAYNQPPHIGYYLPDLFVSTLTLDETSGPIDQTIELGDSIQPIIYHYTNASNALCLGVTSYGLKHIIDKESQTITLHGTPTKEGKAKYTIKLSGNPIDSNATATGIITINTPSSIEHADATSTSKAIFDLFGRRIENPRSGIYIIDGQKVMIR